MEFSERTCIAIANLAEAIDHAINYFLCEGVDNWQDYIVCVDNDLNVSIKYAQEAVDDGSYDIALHLGNFVFSDDDDISVNMLACFEYAENFGPVIEFRGLK